MEHNSRENSPSYTYSRMNSEVVEKPSHFEQSSDSEESLEILALLSSPDSTYSASEQEQVRVLEFGGLSPCSTSKGEGSSIGSFEGGFGDELDEGFDEEFELFDNDELKDTSKDIELNDLNLQRVLIDQNCTLRLSNTLLDDFDLGVDVFEPFQVLDDRMNTPSSPYHNHTPSPVPVNDITGSQSGLGDNGMYYPPTTSFADYDPMNSYSTMTSGASWFNPTLSSVNMPLDLNETIRLMNTNMNDLPNSYTNTPSSPHTPMSADHSPSPCSNNGMARSLSPAPLLRAHTNTGAYYVPSPVESAHSSGSIFSNMSSFSTPNTNNMSEDKIVDIPFHKFKKILDDESVRELDKDRLKCVRRRGKNKVAAKNCRQKKLTMICGLQEEVDQMRADKEMLASKTRGLQQEIARLKNFCARRYNSS